MKGSRPSSPSSVDSMATALALASQMSCRLTKQVIWRRQLAVWEIMEGTFRCYLCLSLQTFPSLLLPAAVEDGRRGNSADQTVLFTDARRPHRMHGTDRRSRQAVLAGICQFWERTWSNCCFSRSRCRQCVYIENNRPCVLMRIARCQHPIENECGWVCGLRVAAAAGPNKTRISSLCTLLS